MSDKPLSAALLAVADSLHNVRLRLARLISEGQLPEWAWPEISIVLTSGLSVAEALQKLADVPPPNRDCRGGAYDPDERR